MATQKEKNTTHKQATILPLLEDVWKTGGDSRRGGRGKTELGGEVDEGVGLTARRLLDDLNLGKY